MNPLILALDTDNLETACQWVAATQSSIATYKVGLEFFLKFGRPGIKALREEGDFKLFLDLKFHDIPSTVGKATQSIGDISPQFLTVHAAGGAAMVQAAVENSKEVAITAVTILTSLSALELSRIGFKADPLTSAVELAKLAVDAGARAIVSSPLEVRAIRERVGLEPIIITPGVRPHGSAQGDQSRTLTPKEAMAVGATYLVIGRPITSYFEDGAKAMSDRAKEILEDATSS